MFFEQRSGSHATHNPIQKKRRELKDEDEVEFNAEGFQKDIFNSDLSSKYNTSQLKFQYRNSSSKDKNSNVKNLGSGKFAIKLSAANFYKRNTSTLSSKMNRDTDYSILKIEPFPQGMSKEACATRHSVANVSRSKIWPTTQSINN